jgi:hypothetical protein
LVVVPLWVFGVVPLWVFVVVPLWVAAPSASASDTVATVAGSAKATEANPRKNPRRDTFGSFLSNML